MKWSDVRDKMDQVTAWAADGLFDYQIAKKLGICVDTLIEWKKSKSEFSEALKTGRQAADEQVQNKLFQRAIGYSYTEEITEERYDTVSGETYEIHKHAIKHVSPDVGAQAFWLKNRMPEVWRDRHELDHSGNMNINGNPFAGLTTEELQRLANADTGETKANR